MKILILTSRFSYPIFSGDTLRIHNIALELSKDNDVTLVSIDGESKGDLELTYDVVRFSTNFRERFFGIFKSLFSFMPIQYGYFNSSDFQDWYKENGKSFDGVVVHLSRLSRHVDPKDFKVSVLEYTDCLDLMYKRALNRLKFSLKKVVYFYESFFIMRSDLKSLEKFDFSVFVSDFDRNEFVGRGADENKIFTISNGVSLRDKGQRGVARNGIMFIGNMRSLPNKSAVEFLLTTVRNKILRENEDVVFNIVGWAPDYLKNEFSSFNNVVFHGECSEDQLLDIASRSFCGVAPVFAAAGIQNKILDYISLGLPVVCSPYSFEGLDFFDVNDFAFSEEHDFWAKVLEVKNESIYWEKLADNNYKILSNYYSWSSKLKKYRDIFNDN